MDSITPTKTLGIFAGNGTFPQTLIKAARSQVPGIRIIVGGFYNETLPGVAQDADEYEEFRLGQLSKPAAFFKKHGVTEVMMAGGIAPKNLFELRPDMKALLMLAKMKERNAETLFTGIADFLEANGLHVILSTTYMDDYIPQAGHIYGPKLKKRRFDDIDLGVRMAAEMCRLYIGQCVCVRHGTILSVEAFDGTNDCLARGGRIGQGKDVTAIKLCKLDQDMRFDAPCVGA
ncbi:MAG: UDP-2,3-diacylglucosamine diphosphatase LpxI, partial [Akkermansia sp.]